MCIRDSQVSNALKYLEYEDDELTDESAYTVSYTHLDVYKRQGFYYDGSMDSINQYAFLVKNCMNTLRIKRIMDSLELPDGVTPDEVNFIVLGRLSNKNKMNLNIALVNNLEAKVHEAVKIIRKERLVQA